MGCSSSSRSRPRGPQRRKQTPRVAEQVAERLAWAADVLGVKPARSLLEIGCGDGVAVSLICERLAGGRITAIDRSKAMVEAAVRRNRTNVASGKAAFRTVALDAADFGTERFDKIFAGRLSAILEERGFPVRRVLVRELEPVPAVCVVARAS